MRRIAGTLVAAAALVGAGLMYGGWNNPASGPPEVSADTVAEAAPQQGQLKTVALKVDGMWCASCGYIVHQALMGTPGVVAAKVGFGDAEVTFDPSKAELADVIAATGKYGFPAELVSG